MFVGTSANFQFKIWIFIDLTPAAAPAISVGGSKLDLTLNKKRSFLSATGIE
ncbi:unnamed protein product [Nesidiocoris tenuis]|uniref:Uncharacterized protein n=1 Tax=Nesidiocoris tenuis TaxID=355587 RepID=A0A6H5GNW1_9HEMI|nr:unnamed protein product [Nesidiocoris tenuis]